VPVPTPSTGSPPALAPENKDINSFDEFDPRAAFTGRAHTSEIDV